MFNPKHLASLLILAKTKFHKSFNFIPTAFHVLSHLTVEGGAIVVVVVVVGVGVGVGSVVLRKTRLVNSGKTDEVLVDSGTSVMFGGAIVFIR